MEVIDREGQIIRERPASIQNAQHASIGTMPGHAAPAIIAVSAPGIDLPYDSPPDPGRVFRPLDHTHKLVAQNALEIHVAFDNFQIGIAHSGQKDSNQRLSGKRLRSGKIRDIVQSIVKVKCSHN